MSDDFSNTSLLSREDLNDELAIIRLRPDSGRVPDFKPGQFITVGLPKDPPPGSQEFPGSPTPEVSPSSDKQPQSVTPPEARPRTRLLRRAFSIASGADQKDYIELYVVLVQEGRFTPKLWKLHPGDRIWMDDKPKGEFTLDGIPEDKDLVMVSTGTGLAPFMSMLRTYQGQARWRRFIVVHGVRLAEDLGYREELERISSQAPDILYLPAVTREPEDSAWNGLRGRVQTVLEPDNYHKLVGADLDPQQTHVFLCGNPQMITATEEMLTKRGFVIQTRNTPGNIHFERYW